MYDWSQHIIGEDASLVDALEQLNKLSGQTMVLFVVDADGKMTGTLTDGDIRRFLIREKKIDVAARDIMHRNFRKFKAGKIEVDDVREMRKNNITLVPCIDADGRIAEVCDFAACRSRLFIIWKISRFRATSVIKAPPFNISFISIS